MLTDAYEGKRYNSPNDVCVDGQGRIWFTDPRYGADRGNLEMDVEGVYRIDPDGKVTRVLTPAGRAEAQRHRGRRRTTRRCTSSTAIDKVGGNRKIWAFELSAEGELGKRRWSTISSRAAAATACAWT